MTATRFLFLITVLYALFILWMLKAPSMWNSLPWLIPYQEPSLIDRNTN